jgi:hypothetical protein
MADSPGQPIDANAVIPEFVQVLADLSWQKLGLRPDAATGTVHRDLDQAKLCIDAVAALVGVMEPRLEGSDLREIRNLVTNLRMNFVQQQEMGG